MTFKSPELQRLEGFLSPLAGMLREKTCVNYLDLQAADFLFLSAFTLEWKEFTCSFNVIITSPLNPVLARGVFTNSACVTSPSGGPEDADVDRCSPSLQLSVPL